MEKWIKLLAISKAIEVGSGFFFLGLIAVLIVVSAIADYIIPRLKQVVRAVKSFLGKWRNERN